MTSRAEYLAALLMANPDIIVTTFLSLILCASVFVGALVLRNREKFQYAASLPLNDDTAPELREGVN